MRARLLVEWVVVASIAFGLVAALALAGLIDRADNALYDSLLTLERPAAPRDVVIVAIDEASLAAIGRWPWPRRTHAALLRRIAADAPRAIGYDVLFLEPSGDDGELARAIAAAGKVLLPIGFAIPGGDGRTFDAQLPVAPIARAVHGLGQAALPFDGDAIVRRAGLMAGGSGQAWPHLAEQLYRTAFGHPSPAFGRIGGAAPPRDRFGIAGAALIPFGRDIGAFQTIPFASVLAGEAPPGLFRDRIVLVGQTAAGSGDQYPVPASRAAAAMPGVEILATLTEGLIHDDLIHPAGRAATRAFVLLPPALLMLALLFLPPRVNLIAGALLMLAMLVASGLLLQLARLWLPPAAGLAGLLVVFPLWAWRRLAATSSYMARELALLDGEPDELPGRRRPPRRRWAWGDTVAEQASLLNGAIARVRDLRRFLADTVQSLPDPTLILDASGVPVIANQAAAALFGVLPPQGTLAGLIARISPDPVGIGLDHEAAEQELGTRDGRCFVLRVAPLATARSERAGWIARLSDISAIRLATRQRERALELLTHDMRSPQASILALLESREEGAALRPRIEAYARRTLALADDFVQLARAESAPYADDLLDLATILVEVADDQWVLAERAGVRIVTPEDGAERLVRGDRSLLARALINLVNNAVKHSPRGGTVRCTIAPVHDDPAMLCCAIEDEGPGVPPDAMPTIFEPFRTAGSGGRDVAGAGLGLAFVHTVVERHGGKVACTNRAEGGAIFTLHLPHAAAGAIGTDA